MKSSRLAGHTCNSLTPSNSRVWATLAQKCQGFNDGLPYKRNDDGGPSHLELDRRVDSWDRKMARLDPVDYETGEILAKPIGAGGRERKRVRPSHKGLSNTPYFPAKQSQLVEMLIRPASAMIRVRPAREYAQVDYKSVDLWKRAKRGVIREHSKKSLLNLRLKAWDLSEVVKPELMITLTYPGEFRSVTTDWTCFCEASEGCSDVPCICDFSPSGKVCKEHLDTFRKRIERYFKRVGLANAGCLWFLEFQTRGAPHFHLIFWGMGFALFDLGEFQKWLSRAWAEIVGHADPHEYQKHLGAGTNAEWMEVQNFGYASAYASKPHQKEVPREFADIGRFWGIWNSPLGSPVLRAIYATSKTLDAIGQGLQIRLCKYALDFANELEMLFFRASVKGNVAFTKRVFGVDCAKYLLSYGKSKELISTVPVALSG